MKVTWSAFFFLLLEFATGDEVKSTEWWDNGLVYQVYPRSFKDSDGDGIGDLNGITSKLEHIRDTGAVALWLSPIYESPQADFGYDISNYTAIDRIYGTLEDFRRLVAKAKSLGLKVLLDMVLNHSSHQHEWFKKSLKRIKPYDNYYVWHDGKQLDNGTRLPPNNWISIFSGPAWSWNEERQQYYYHQFGNEQPDLNYRSAELREEVENILKFWLDQGVDGFRMDAIIHLYEDAAFRDEPLSHAAGVPSYDYAYLDHIYTKDLDETFDTVAGWRKLIDQYAEEHKSESKFAIVEAGVPLPVPIDELMRYYQVGMDPFNFMFILWLNNGSHPSDFAREMNIWMDNMPEGKVANWVLSNHDNPRVASRFGYDSNRADQLSMLAAVMPGIMVIYNGDEIGMLDRPMTWEETVDPSGCNAGKDRYYLKSRDPERTPFQWDNSTSAGFSSNPKTWLPVNSNYKWLNLAAQKEADISHYKIFLSLIELRKTSLLRNGEYEIKTDKDDRVLVVIRKLPKRNPVVLLINFAYKDIELNLKDWLSLPSIMNIYTASMKSTLKIGSKIKTNKFLLPSAASVILTGNDVY